MSKNKDTNLLSKINNINSNILLLKKELIDVKKILNILVCEFKILRNVKNETNNNPKKIKKEISQKQESQKQASQKEINNEKPETKKRKRRNKTKENNNKPKLNEFVKLSKAVKDFLNINSSSSNDDDKIKISELNNYINQYVLNNNLLENDNVLLNLELKKLLKTKKKLVNINTLLILFLKLLI